jgi:hypothetical protein
MRNAVLTCALLCAALGLPLGFTPRQTRLWSVAALLTSALIANVAVAHAHSRSGWADAVFLNSWISVVGSALSVYLPCPVGIFAALALSLNAGIWCGAVNALAGSPIGILESLPAVALLWPIGWAVRCDATLAVKVVGSWLIAMAMLSATLQFLPVTPGYLPDHLE